ncbi:3'-5' exonuclease [Zavarzinella formosa]|uniref:3'-5' exonuclease n=1 Tax=Zavarzinella formosa TaxID=360055 RepID=UPI0002F7D48E|nr:3'-5' exonuclease [Zavarzinella formosa]
MIPTPQHLVLSRPLVFLDTETTGRDAAHDRIIEFGAIRLVPSQPPQVRHTRLNPGLPIPSGATAVHGITDGDVADCPRFAMAAPALFRFLADADLAGYNVAFDLRFLQAEFGRCGLDLSLEGRAILDPMQIFHRREPRNLAAAVRFYCQRPLEGAHSALADAAAAAAVLEAQLERYDDLPRTPARLHQQLAPVDVGGKFRSEGGEIVFAFGKHLGRRLDQVVRDDPAYLAWMLDRDFLPDTKAVIRTALGQDPRNQG